MLCNNCNVKINPEFKFAIKNNKCPACGNEIMAAEQLMAFTALKELLLNVEKEDTDGIVSIIVANFDIKQKFKNVPTASLAKANAPQKKMGSLEDIEVVEDPDKKFDEEFKKNQMKKAKEMLKEQAYESALKNQYGMDDEEDMFGDDSGEGEINPIVQATRMKQEFKKSDSQNKILTGGGAFSRSG